MIRWFEKGQGMLEYAVILILVAAAVIAMVYIFGGAVANLYQYIIQRI
jgi:Flp pilus assembly pilin Flp